MEVAVVASLHVSGAVPISWSTTAETSTLLLQPALFAELESRDVPSRAIERHRSFLKTRGKSE